ncbi:hypothetical protein MS_034 [Vibrio phage VPMS1]|uniref:hypothetical protein n=1 Tax=Vibrio phage VPMS1 TaxID=1233488 RepID=UPI0003585EBC|nr:hypothetical protein MS_034 [Vibrio phage VPMS1]AFV51113.1 hypothetical protein MS_034 [Vibrio phage VPMS1]
MERILNIDEAAEYLNMCGDWVLVSHRNFNVLASGDKTQQVPPTLENATLYIDAVLGAPVEFSQEVVLIDMSSFKPKQAVKGSTGADTIKARESVYGPFHVHAAAEQAMKRAMTSQPGWERLNDVQKSAAEMIMHKLARILNGSADYDDNWHDISGYATLAENEIKSRLSGSSSDEN